MFIVALSTPSVILNLFQDLVHFPSGVEIYVIARNLVLIGIQTPLLTLDYYYYYYYYYYYMFIKKGIIMPNPEGYQPSPAETRAAEATMDERQQELTETREDALFEGRKKTSEPSNNQAELAELHGYTLEDAMMLKKIINSEILTGAKTMSMGELSREINRSLQTVVKILDDMDIRHSGGYDSAYAHLPKEEL